MPSRPVPAIAALHCPAYPPPPPPPGSDSLLPAQLQAVAAERSGGQVTVVALDATWGNARRMQGWFPKGVSEGRGMEAPGI